MKASFSRKSSRLEESGVCGWRACESGLTSMQHPEGEVIMKDLQEKDDDLDVWNEQILGEALEQA